MTLRIGLITTLDHNIGDDFIRHGALMVLREVFKSRKIEFVSVNKHKPYTIYNKWHPIQVARAAKYLPRGRHRVREWIDARLAPLGRNEFDTCQVIVQCGAPVIFPECHRAEWAELLWRQIIRRLHDRVTVMNLAVGSCFPWRKQPAEIVDKGEATFLASIADYCKLTTARDKLSQALFKGLGRPIPQICCSALLAAGGPRKPAGDDGLIFINYMQGGGHYSFGQEINDDQWRDTMRDLIARLSTRHKVAFLCHTEKEHLLAGELVPGIPRFFPKTAEEYFEVASRAKTGVFNRMHAAVGLAGMGIPSVAVCTDTRLLMVKALDLPCYFVSDATAAQLEQDVERMLANRNSERERLLNLRSETWNAYVDKVSAVTGHL